jgi:hypothetical protein
VLFFFQWGKNGANGGRDWRVLASLDPPSIPLARAQLKVYLKIMGWRRAEAGDWLLAASC